MGTKDIFYSAALLFRSLRNGAYLPENLWEESVILIRAYSPEEALEKANKIGRTGGTTYTATDGSEVTWEFFKVECVFQVIDDLAIDGLADGAEVFSRFLRNSEVESLLTPFEET
ncbi:MAG: DUF4288 domain-containing protein [Burkholderiaceae bacterium]|jgi:hypothetical protein|nr:DUF4288 domain-containing protein [Burkholderiaceae bacterium]